MKRRIRPQGTLRKKKGSATKRTASLKNSARQKKISQKKKGPAKKTRKKLPRRSARKSSKKRRHTLIPLLLFGSGLACLLFFFFVDGKVVNALKTASKRGGTSLYSAPLPFHAPVHMPGKMMRKELLFRGYTEEQSHVLEQGEFRLSSDELLVHRRSFTDEEGRKVAAEKFRVYLPSGEVFSGDGRVMPIAFLEPHPIARSGSADVRIREYLPLSKIPKTLQQAFLAIEDERFYSHFGIDVFGIARALFANLRAGRVVQGGSSITQQLAKNLFLSSQRTYGRKFLELFAAVSLELRLSKDEILERYLNEVYFGQEGLLAIHGVQSASQFFFGKQAADLSIAEQACLAGLVKAPSALSPRRHPEAAKERRNVVLSKMHELEMITRQVYLENLVLPLQTVKGKRFEQRAPYFASSLQTLLARQLNTDALALKDLNVYSGLHYGLQVCAEEELSNFLTELQKQYKNLRSGPLQGALIAIDTESALVKAWVGGRDYTESQFDRVIHANRQIGSTVKPFLYLSALDPQLNSYRPATAISVLPDAPLGIRLPSGQVWRPENYDHKFRGDVTLRYAMEKSLNVPAVYVGQKVGFATVARVLESFRVAPHIPALPSVTLGAIDSNLLRLTAAYAALASGGIYREPRLFLTVQNEATERILRSKLEEERVSQTGPVFLLNNLLQGVVERGTGSIIRQQGFTGMAAGKTGTSNEARDAWFIGYSPHLALGIWIGFDDNRVFGLSGARAAAPLWGNIMRCAEGYFPQKQFVAPHDIRQVRIDAATGLLYDPACSGARPVEELFVVGTEPRKTCRGEFMSPQERLYSPGEAGREPPRRKSSFWETLFGR